MDNKIENNRKVVWVTGGTSGIGLATVKNLVDNRFAVVASGRTKPELLPEEAYFAKMDVTDVSSIAYGFAEIKSKLGKVDILINNAGAYLSKETLEITQKDYDKLFDTNVKGALFVIKAVLPSMIKMGSGIIINISSIASEKTFASGGLYSATKSALNSLANSLREEVRDKGIDIVNLLPGATVSNVWDTESIEKFSNKMMKAEDVAEAIHNLIDLSSNSRLIPEKLVVRPKLGDL